MTKRTKAVRLSEMPELNDDDEADIDIYGADDEEEGSSDVNSVDLDNDDDTIDSLDDDGVSDDDNSVDGQSVDAEADVDELVDKVNDLISQLADLAGGDDMEDDDDDMEDEGGEVEVDDDLGEAADSSAWSGKMQTLSAPAGQDGKEQDSISDPKYTNRQGKAKALPKGKKPTGDEGVEMPKDEYELNVKADDATSKITNDPVVRSKGQAKAVLDVVNKMLSGQGKTIQALYKGSDLKNRTMESLDFTFSDEDKARLAELDEALSPEFLDAAAELMESKVQLVVDEAVENIDSQYVLALSEEIGRIEENLATSVSEYMDYVVEQYMEDNRVAIEEGQSRSLDNSFMDGLRDLFENHYVDVPKGKEDLVEKLENEIAKKDDKLKETTRKAIKIRNENIALKRNAVINETTDDLSMNEAEELRLAAESLEWAGVNEFRKEVQKLKETRFARHNTQTEHEFEALAESAEDNKIIPGSMESYLSAIRRTTNK